MSAYFHFFFQAEDGIRDGHVTGVQTCALPIYPQCIVRYAERIQTQQDHAQEIRQHYSYKEFSDRRGGFALMRFLYARAWVGTERPSVLFDLATTWLLDKKVLLPGVTTLTRLISSIRERVAERLWQRLSEVCTPEQRTDLE